MILYGILGADRAEQYSFKQDFFFDFLLPPIILNSGFNMRRKKFFQNLGNIAIFGLCVTFVCFTIYSVASFYVIKAGTIEMVRRWANTNLIRSLAYDAIHSVAMLLRRSSSSVNSKL